MCGQVGGTTLHSFAGIGAGTASVAACVDLASRKTVAAQWKRCRHLIIDEISMVDGNYFKKLEHVARQVQRLSNLLPSTNYESKNLKLVERFCQVRNNDKPFGGIQLILTGDCCKLGHVDLCSPG